MIEQGPANRRGQESSCGVVDHGSELHGVDDMRSYIGHTAWKAAPSVHIEVDGPADLLTVSCYHDFPDIEVDPSTALSVAFHRNGEEYLLTSLCLYGVSRWADSPTEDPLLAHSLLGETVGDAVESMLGGGSSTVELSKADTAELLLTWRLFCVNANDRYPPR